MQVSTPTATQEVSMFDEVAALLDTRLEFHESQLQYHQKRVAEIQDMKQYLSLKFAVPAETPAEEAPAEPTAEADTTEPDASTDEPVTEHQEANHNGHYVQETTDHAHDQSMY